MMNTTLHGCKTLRFSPTTTSELLACSRGQCSLIRTSALELIKELDTSWQQIVKYFYV